MEVTASEETNNENGKEFDPISDIIDYLVRCAKISFKNAKINESEVRTSEKIKMASDVYQRSPTEFLLQFGKYLAPHHLGYFESLQSSSPEDHQLRDCIDQLKTYHSNKGRHQRIRNRRYNALRTLKTDTDYFSEKQMMFRNPLLYEQLVGQYLTDEEVRRRDNVDHDSLTLLNMILETVDRNQMRQMRNEQILEEHSEQWSDAQDDSSDSDSHRNHKRWGDFEVPDTRPPHTPDHRKRSTLPATEKYLLREEFLQEMYTSFIEGRDEGFDYSQVDDDEQYDDLQQVAQDAEDRYFDSETNDTENLEEHMKLVQEYRGSRANGSTPGDDSLDIFMKHITNKIELTYTVFVHLLCYTPTLIIINIWLTKLSSERLFGKWYYFRNFIKRNRIK